MGGSDYNQRRRRLTTKLSCGPRSGSCPSDDLLLPAAIYLRIQRQTGPYAVNTQAHKVFHATGLCMWFAATRMVCDTTTTITGRGTCSFLAKKRKRKKIRPQRPPSSLHVSFSYSADQKRELKKRIM
jgi:hypothetical protein